jgi:RimJ/RimL family protein N-acetyltransferase
MEYFLEKLMTGDRDAAGWYNCYALRKAEGDMPCTLVGTGGFTGLPDAAGTAELGYYIAASGNRVDAGLVQQGAATSLVHQLVALIRWCCLGRFQRVEVLFLGRFSMTHVGAVLLLSGEQSSPESILSRSP